MKAALCAALLTLIVSDARAWGNDGHRIVGHIARSLLNDTARQRVQTLLGTDDLAELATDMDENRDGWERRHPGASKWHYENRAVCEKEISCPQGQCVTRQLEKFIDVLRDSRSSREKQAEALSVVIHLLADLHQPLHLADDKDRGGNDVWVFLPHEREPRRLHEVWDTRLVRLAMQRRSAPAYAEQLLGRYAERQRYWSAGSIASWAEESYAAGKQGGYLELPNFSCSIGRGSRKPLELGVEYLDGGQRIVAEQLSKAGFRLATTLNAVLGSTQKTKP